MMYFLVFSKSKKSVLLTSKSALHDWIAAHSFCLTGSVARRISLHRVVESPRAASQFVVMTYQVGPRICSLKDYIIRQNLDLFEL